MIVLLQGSVNVYLPVIRKGQSLSLTRLEGAVLRIAMQSDFRPKVSNKIDNWSSSCYLQYIENDFQSRFKLVSQIQKYV